MSTTRFEGAGVDVATYAGPAVCSGRRRRWQLTNVVDGGHVSFSDAQFRAVAEWIRAAGSVDQLGEIDADQLDDVQRPPKDDGS